MEKYDLVLFGATGFTGRQVTNYLTKIIPDGFKWAIAGRNQKKLLHLQNNIHHTNLPDYIVVDGCNSDDMARLVGQARLIASTAGPFALYGELLIEQCAKQGVDYLDITGEPAFIHRMIERYDEIAKNNGAKIIPFCGFDSIPFDMGTHIAVSYIRNQWSEYTTSVCAYVELRSGVNGGTFKTLLTTLSSGDWKIADQLDVMLPKQNNAVTLQKDRTEAVFSTEMNRWTVPHVMAPINSRVVNRSAVLSANFGEKYSEVFLYDECQLLGALINQEKAQTMAKTNQFAQTYQRKNGVPEYVIEQYPKPGEGPSDALIEKGFYRITFVAYSISGQIVKVVFSGKGDPSNKGTAIFLAESALSIALQRDELPGANTRFGFLTPATALGDVLIERLRSANITIHCSPFVVDLAK